MTPTWNDDVFTHRPRRRRGQAARAAHRGPGEARGAVRRPLPPDRLRALQPGERAATCTSSSSPSTRATASTATSSTTWRLSPLLGNYVTPVPAQMRLGPRWFVGSADAIFQNFNLINDEAPEYIIVFGADHIYRMDPRQMVEQHRKSGAGVTVAAIRAPLEQADQFGVIETASDGRTIAAFREKPKDAKPLADAPDQVYASMGNYVFSTRGADRRGHAATPRTRTPSTTSAATSSRCSSRAARPRSTTSPTTRSRAPPSATAATGATWGRSTPTTTPTWTSPRSTRSSTSTTTSGRSTRGRTRCRRPSSSSTARTGAGTRSTP